MDHFTTFFHFWNLLSANITSSDTWEGQEKTQLCNDPPLDSRQAAGAVLRMLYTSESACSFVTFQTAGEN